MSPFSSPHRSEGLSLLAHMSSLFAAGLDEQQTLQGVVELFVPSFASWASIDLMETTDVMRRVAVASIPVEGHEQAMREAHANPEPFREGNERFVNAQHAQVIHVEDMRDFPWPLAPHRAALIREVLPISLIFAPLRARGETLGVLEVLAVRGERRYSDADVSLVEDIAQRASFAILNARLVQELTRELQLSENALERLEESELRYRRTFEGNPLPLWLYDVETLRFVDVNPAAVEVYGYTRPEFLGMTILDIRPTIDRPRVLGAVRDSGAHVGTHHPGVFEHRRKDGSTLLVEIHSHEVDVEGRRCRLVQAIDVTERVHTLQSLRNAEERHQLLTRVTKEAIWEWNVATDAIAWSQTVYDLFHFTRDEVLPTREWFRSRVHPEDRARTDDVARMLATSDVETVTVSFRFQRGNGSFASVESRMVIARRDGQVERVVGSLADVTTEQAVSEQLAIAQRMEAVGRLAGGVAHDFNNLLTAIRGFASFALDDQLPSSRARDDIEQILQAADRAAALTRQLLAFSRRQVLQPQLASVNEILRNLQKMLARVLGEDVEVQPFLAPDLAPVVVDPGQIEQVIMNLVVNARDAMPDGGLLTIETMNVTLDEDYAATHLDATAGEHVMIAITDTGIGMDAATMRRIFEPFFSTKDRDKGTGLGLATSYGIIRQSGGHIGVYSEPGKGTTFRVYLPHAADQVAPTPRQVPASFAPIDGHEAVLVVEDDDRVRRVSTNALTRHGYLVFEARSAESALDIFRAEQDRIAIVVCDIVLPRMSGIALVSELRAIKPDVRVLHVSGYTENAFLLSGTLDRSMELLEKPFAPETLVRRVRTILDRPASA